MRNEGRWPPASSSAWVSRYAATGKVSCPGAKLSQLTPPRLLGTAPEGTSASHEKPEAAGAVLAGTSSCGGAAALPEPEPADDDGADDDDDDDGGNKGALLPPGLMRGRLRACVALPLPPSTSARARRGAAAAAAPCPSSGGSSDTSITGGGSADEPSLSSAYSYMYPPRSGCHPIAAFTPPISFPPPAQSLDQSLEKSPEKSSSRDGLLVVEEELSSWQ